MIRPSALPKLALCSKYEGAAGTTPAASRGTTMDESYREKLQGNDIPFNALPEEDKPAVEWAVAKTLEYAKGNPVETREEYLRMHVPGIEHVGTADAECQSMGWVADLKTGQMRSYHEQMAAYALAVMHRDWTKCAGTHVLYADEQKVASYLFTYDSAKKVVDSILAEVRNPEAQPVGNEYCGWCRHANVCPSRVVDAEATLAVVSDDIGLVAIRERILASPDRAGEFMRQWKLAEKEVAEPVMSAVREMMDAGTEIPGWKLIQVKGRGYYDAEAIMRAAEAANVTLDTVILAMGGNMSADKFTKWLADIGLPPDDYAPKVGNPSTQLRQSKSKH